MNHLTDQGQQPTPRIGYVLKVYPRFSETFIVTEILAREAHGDDVSIYALRPTTDARFHPELARIQAKVSWIPRPMYSIGLWEELRSIVAHPQLSENFRAIMPELMELPNDEVAQGTALARAAVADGITHFHAHFASLAGRVTWIASKITGIPFTITTHAKDIFHKSVDPVWLRRICGDAERVIAISRFNEDYLDTVLEGTDANVSLCYNALELERFPMHEPLPSPPTDSPLRIAAVGRLVPKKGFSDLIDAVARLRDLGVAVDLSIGGDGELRQSLQDHIDELGIGDVARLLGPLNQAEVRSLTKDSHVFVAPCIPAKDGNIDGLPTVVLEAMATGVPVIATAVTGLPEVVRNQETGVLIEPGDVDALVDALKSFAAGAHDVPQLVANARSLIESSFDSRQQAAQLSTWQSGTTVAKGDGSA